MLRLEHHDDVTRLAFTTISSRLMGFGVSAYAVRGALVDCGFPGVRDDLMRWIASQRPEGVLLTHWHEDHAGNAEALARRGTPIGMLDETRARLRAFGRIGWYRRACWGVPDDLTSSVVPFEHPALRLVPARGHSEDHHVVWDEARDTVFGGDLFIGVKVRIAHHHEDLRSQVTSLRAIAALKPRRYFDGHRGLLPNAVDQLLTKASWIEETIAAVESRARRGMGPLAIRDEVLGREDIIGIASRGDYSRLNWVESVLASMPDGSTSAAARE